MERLNSSPVRSLGERVFTDADQARFAELSGDRNPMHLDPLAARRSTVAGRPIVYGMHLLLTSLERWYAHGGDTPTAVRCSFDHQVSVGDTVTFTQRDRDAQRAVIDVAVGRLVCARVSIDTSASGRHTPATAQEQSPRPISNVDDLRLPIDAAPESYVGRQYEVTRNGADWSAECPHTVRCLGNDRVGAMATMSYFVGMVCPGLHSMLSGVKIDLAQRGAGALACGVRSYDPRFRLFDITVDGPIRGRIEAFARHPVAEQPSMAEIATRVSPNEFKGTRSLVIGGSRGLGELTSKILAAGGGDVAFTYASGTEDARRVEHEIVAAGRSCSAQKFDLLVDDVGRLTNEDPGFDVVYLFATPRIFRSHVELFDAGLFQEFAHFYVEQLYRLCAHFERLERKATVFFPSSVAVSERPKGLTEYAMAKAAAELLIADINASFEHVSVKTARLPRMATDQTASLLPVDAASNLDTLLPIVRSLSARA